MIKKLVYVLKGTSLSLFGLATAFITVFSRDCPFLKIPNSQVFCTMWFASFSFKGVFEPGNVYCKYSVTYNRKQLTRLLATSSLKNNSTHLSFSVSLPYKGVQEDSSEKSNYRFLLQESLSCDELRFTSQIVVFTLFTDAS